MNPGVPPLTTEQQVVLQAIYDHFREHAAWPTFTTIDRPLRRQHGWDTGAIFQGLPDSLIAPLGPGRIQPIESDELRLKLLGIQACRGGSEDTERFVRLLRWFAEREMAYEPEPGSDDLMPRVTSEEIREYLGLGGDDRVALNRLLPLLRLGNWGLAGSGSTEDNWYVILQRDVWRFRNVQTVQDCIDTQSDKGRPAVQWLKAVVSYYHVRVLSKATPAWGAVELDLSEDELRSRFLVPRREGRSIVINGTTVSIRDLVQLRISMSSQPSTAVRTNPDCRNLFLNMRQLNVGVSEDWLIAESCADVTDHFVTEPPGQPAQPPTAEVFFACYPELLADVLLERIYDTRQPHCQPGISADQSVPIRCPTIERVDNPAAIQTALVLLQSHGYAELLPASTAGGRGGTAVPMVKITPAGAAHVAGTRSIMTNEVERNRAARNSLLVWLHEQRKDPRGAVAVDGMLLSPHGALGGQFFNDEDVDDASAYLEQKGLITGSGVDRRQGPVLARITVDGIDCIEQGGNVADYTRRPGKPDVTYSFNAPVSGANFSAGDHNTQHAAVNGIDAAGLQSVMTAITDTIANLRMPPEDERALMAATAQVTAEIAQRAPDKSTIGIAVKKVLVLLGKAGNQVLAAAFRIAVDAERARLGLPPGD